MEGQRTRPPDLDLNSDDHHLNYSNSYGEDIQMSDFETRGGYRPLHLEAFPPNLETNLYVTSNKFYEPCESS